MELTDERKQKIDALKWYALATVWRSGSLDDPWLQGETGEYWKQRLEQLTRLTLNTKPSPRFLLTSPSYSIYDPLTLQKVAEPCSPSSPSKT